MDQQIKLYRVFIASPGDLADERKALRDVVERINGICARETDWRIELLGWEDTLPGAGRPQELINADLEKLIYLSGAFGKGGEHRLVTETRRASKRNSVAHLKSTS